MIDYNEIAVNEKQKNILMILDQIAVRKETCATDIIEATGLSFATVSRAISVLKKTQIVVPRGKEITDMGRHPETYSLNADYGCLLHFFVDTHSIKGYLADFCGDIIILEQIEINRNITPEVFARKIRMCAESLLKKRGISYDKLLAASIAIPGMVDVKNRVIKRIPNFVNFKNVNLFQFAQEAMQVPVIINNAARLCAFGAYMHDFPDKANLVYIDFTRHSGIGAGIIVDGKLVSGQGGFAGEMGDILVDIRNFSNGFHDEEGCLESTAGVGVLYSRLYNLMERGYAEILKELLAKSDTKSLNLELIEQAIHMHDLDTMDVFYDIMKMWASAIITLCAILDPDLIILGGVVNEKNEMVQARMQHYVSKVLSRRVNMALGGTNEYQMYGGLHMLSSYVFNNMLAEKLFD